MFLVLRYTCREQAVSGYRLGTALPFVGPPAAGGDQARRDRSGADARGLGKGANGNSQVGVGRGSAKEPIKRAVIPPEMGFF